jgi:hypothetical protein
MRETFLEAVGRSNIDKRTKTAQEEQAKRSGFRAHAFYEPEA